jgi:NAD+--dinitrogen-reductase ADP-D-ribosyltransferase
MPLNRCNLPPVILGSLTYQRFPVPLELDGVRQAHRDLFDRLAHLAGPADRARQFTDYMDVHFLLRRREDAGWTPDVRRDRSKADYRALVRGWMFDPDGTEAAVLKGWVESRFGLVPRYHRGPIRNLSDETYRAYREQWAAGLYNSNALEAQLDLLYAYCQSEIHRTCVGRSHLRLYRGVNHLEDHELLAETAHGRVVVLNNLSSFTSRRDSADSFGDYIMEVDVPLPKIGFHCTLLPGLLQGEDEFAVIGGACEVRFATL